MPKSFLSTLSSLLLIGASLLSSCDLNDFNDAKLGNINPAYAIPLVDDSLTTVDLVKRRQDDGSLRTDSDSTYFFLFSSDVSSPTAEEILTINDVERNVPIVVPANSPATTLQTITVELPLVSGNINNLLAKGGELYIELNGTDRDFESAQIDLRNNIENLNITINQLNRQLIFPLDGRQLNFGTNNSIRFNVVIIRFPGSSQNGNYTLTVGCRDVEFRYIRGDINFGSLIGSSAEPIRVKLFDKQFREDADVFFANPSLTLNFRNTFGTGVIGSINSFLGLIEPNSVPYPLTGPGIADLRNFPVAAAQFNNQQLSSASTSTFTLDRNNSSIIDFLRPAPRFINISPAGQVEGTQNNVQAVDTSRFSINASVRLPVLGFVNRYALTDTFEISDLPENTTSSSVLSAQIKLVFYNQFPVNVTGNIYFANAANQIIDSLIVRESNGSLNRILAIGAAAGAAPEFRVPLSNVVRNERIFNVSKERYENIQKNTTKGIFVAFLNSTGANNQQLHRIYTDYFVRFKLGAQVATEFNLNN